MPEAEYYKKFLFDGIVSFTEQLVNNFMDKDGHDLSPVLRGRLYQLKEVIGIVEEIDSFDKMRLELTALESEGYKATPDEQLVN